MRPVSGTDRPGLACGRAMCSSCGSSTASAGTSPTRSTPCRTCRVRGVGPASVSLAKARRGVDNHSRGPPRRLVFGILRRWPSSKRELICERTVAGPQKAARARADGRAAGKFTLSIVAPARPSGAGAEARRHQEWNADPLAGGGQEAPRIYRRGYPGLGD